MKGRTSPIQTAPDLMSDASKPYRYGFNGQEHDFEIFNSGSSSYTAEFWQYDSRLGRRWNTDPLPYDWQSPYSAFNNNPLVFADPFGLRGDDKKGGTKNKKGEGKPVDQGNYNHGPFTLNKNEPSTTDSPTLTKMEPIPTGTLSSPTISADVISLSGIHTVDPGSSHTLSATVPTFWDNVHAAGAMNWQVKMSYDVVNDFYTGANWLINRQMYDLRGSNVGATAAKNSAFNLNMGILTLPLGGLFEEVNSVKGTINELNSVSSKLDGSFSVWDWSGYPKDIPKPNGPFRLIEGTEYSAARSAANKANMRIIKDLEIQGQGIEIHEIVPIKFGGSPTDINNKIFLDAKFHRSEVTPFWNTLMRSMK